jgi:hypothetical protein
MFTKFILPMLFAVSVFSLPTRSAAVGAVPTYVLRFTPLSLDARTSTNESLSSLTNNTMEVHSGRADRGADVSNVWLHPNYR